MTSNEEIHKQFEEKGFCLPQNLIVVGTAAKGVDIYGDNKNVYDIAIGYLVKLNDILEDTPFLTEFVLIAKLKKMKNRLNSGYTSFWS